MKLLTILILTAICALNSCESFLEIASPTSKIPTELIFQDEDMATSAIIGIYISLYSSAGFASGTNQSVLTLAGLSADELRNTRGDPIYLQFQNNSINPSEPTIETLWLSMYTVIYAANSALEGIDRSSVLTATVKNQLKGEALFIRAFCYFYLINLFGDVPLATGTDYNVNNQLSRTPINDVYDQIKSDLSISEDLLQGNYVGDDRTRVNKAAAMALSARVYLYTGDWARAEDKASAVIGNANLYELPATTNVFLSTSKESIWQLKPLDGIDYTNEGYFFGVSHGPFNSVLKDEVISVFESGDNRKASWTTSIISESDTVYLSFKYKRDMSPSLFPAEFSMVLRLAEMYLVRAESRLQQDKLSLAIADVDKIRLRANLPSIHVTNPGISKEGLINAIEQERRIEFLAEWGHRWLDLKRWNKAKAVLGSKKSSWTDDDLLYPIPSAEFSKNHNLKPQNHGY